MQIPAGAAIVSPSPPQHFVGERVGVRRFNLFEAQIALFSTLNQQIYDILMYYIPMKAKIIFLVVISICLSPCLVRADGQTNITTNSLIRNLNGYSVTHSTNGHLIYLNPGEFWPGVWKEDTNGWRVQLRLINYTNLLAHSGVTNPPSSTNVVLIVEWGSTLKNSGDGYLMTPNGKFAKFELSDGNGSVVPPNPNAGTNILLTIIRGRSLEDLGSRNLYGDHLPSWAEPSRGALTAFFPKTISTSVYPHWFDGRVVGETGCATNIPPSTLASLNLDEIYSITNEGDYTLAVQPVLYKRYNHKDEDILDRVDLPCVKTTIHLVPKKK
jgi:hypothetical protein